MIICKSVEQLSKILARVYVHILNLKRINFPTHCLLNHLIINYGKVSIAL